VGQQRQLAANNTSLRIAVSTEDALDDVGERAWRSLAAKAEIPSVFVDYAWVSSWWAVFGRDRALRVYCAFAQDRLVGILPTVWTDGAREPVSLVGEPHADYACILTDPTVPGVFQRLVQTACSDLPKRGILRLPELRSDSSYPAALGSLGKHHTKRWIAMPSTPCPRTRLDAETLSAVLAKKSLRRHARGLERHGDVKTQHYYEAEQIIPRLGAFFDQHVRRWQGTGYPSLFCSEENQEFYRELVRRLSGSGQLVFSEVTLNENPVASHFGFISEADLIWYKPSFEPTLARHSPGEVLIYELFRLAGQLRAKGVDFTRGDEPFKHRFANDVRSTSTFVYYERPLAAMRIRVARHLKSLTKTVVPRRILNAGRYLRDVVSA